MDLEKIVIENGDLIVPSSKDVYASFKRINCREVENGKTTRLVIENGKISFVGIEESNERINKKYANYAKINAKCKIVSPGFINTHVHINSEFRDVEDIYEKIRGKSLDFLKQGVTSYMLATMALPDLGLEELLDAIRIESKCDTGPQLFGVVIEGPFTNPKMAGAMDIRFVSKRPRFYLQGLIDCYENIQKKIVLAPEMHQDYYNFIRKVKKRKREDIILSIGHSLAEYKEAVRAINEGVRVINHFYNRISPFHHRDLGIVGAIFDSIQYLRMRFSIL